MFKFTRKKHWQKAYRSRIDLDELRNIPIVRVAEALGMKLRCTGPRTWSMIDPEDPKHTTSLVLFGKKNNWKRFSGRNDGGVSWGSTIDLVIHIHNNPDFKSAIQFLSNHCL